MKKRSAELVKYIDILRHVFNNKAKSLVQDLTLRAKGNPQHNPEKLSDEEVFKILLYEIYPSLLFDADAGHPEAILSSSSRMLMGSFSDEFMRDLDTTRQAIYAEDIETSRLIDFAVDIIRYNEASNNTDPDKEVVVSAGQYIGELLSHYQAPDITDSFS